MEHTSNIDGRCLLAICRFVELEAGGGKTYSWVVATGVLEVIINVAVIASLLGIVQCESVLSMLQLFLSSVPTHPKSFKLVLSIQGVALWLKVIVKELMQTPA